MSGHCDFCQIWHSGGCCHPGRAILEAQRQDIERLNDEAAVSRGDYRLLNALQEETEKQLTELEDKIIEQEKEMEVLTFKVSNLTAEKDVAGQEIQRLRNQLEAELKLNTELSAEGFNLEHDVIAAIAEIKQLKEEIEEYWRNQAGESR